MQEDTLHDRSQGKPLPVWLPWAIWGLPACFFLYGFFQRVAPSVMHDRLMAEFDLTGAAVGNLSALYFYTYASLQIPVGLMADRFGPRRLLLFGALICAGATLLFAWSGDSGTAHMARAFVGFGAGFGFVCALTLAARWLPAERFAQVTGLQMMAGMIGGFLAQAPLAALVEEIGWRQALAGSGLFGLLLAAALWLIVRDFPPGRHPSKGPSKGSSQGAPGLSLSLWLSLSLSLGRVLSRRQNVVTAILCSAMSAPMLSFAGFWGVAWLMQTKGYDRPEAGAATSLLLLGWALGSPLAGWISDRLGRPKAVIRGGCLAALITLTALIHLPALPGPLLLTLFPLAGASCGCMSVAFALVRAQTPPGELGATFGFVNAATTAAGAIFQPLIGWLLDLGWTGAGTGGVRLYSAEAFQNALSVLPVFLLLALGLSAFLQEAKKGPPEQ